MVLPPWNIKHHRECTHLCDISGPKRTSKNAKRTASGGKFWYFLFVCCVTSVAVLSMRRNVNRSA